MANLSDVSLWDTVVVNMAPIIIALTGFGAMVGGFYMQKRMMDKQNEKIDRNATTAANERGDMNSKIDAVRASTDGMKDELVKATAKAAHSEGVAEGRELEKTNHVPDV